MKCRDPPSRCSRARRDYLFFKVTSFLLMSSLDIPACIGIPVSLGIPVRLTGFLIWVVSCVSVSVTAIVSPNVSVMCVSRGWLAGAVVLVMRVTG